MTLDQETLVAGRDVGFRYASGPWLFRNLAFDLSPGHLYAVTGASGSGKSSLLGLMSGHVNPSEGTVTRSTDNVQWVFQTPHGDPRRTVVDHVSMPVLARGASRARADAVARQLLSRVGLGSIFTARFGEVSGGQAQRIMLARALAARPGLLLVDEPTAQLDRTSARSLTEILRGLADGQTVVVIATHDSATRDACTDEIRLDDGPSAEQRELK